MTEGPVKPDVTRPARIHAIRAGLLCRCPNCGKGGQFSGFLKAVDTCAVCGFNFTRLNPGDGAAIFVMQIAGGIVVFTALFAGIVWSPPMGMHPVIVLPLVLVLSLGLMRPGKGAMIPLQRRNKAGQAGRDD